MGQTTTNQPSASASASVSKAEVDGARDAGGAQDRGDARASSGDWVGAVAAWRAAAEAGDPAAIARLRTFVASFGQTETTPESVRVPRRALAPLAICGEATAFALLAMIGANRVDDGPDTVLLAFGWVAVAVAAAAALLFAARSGRLDGGSEAFAARAAVADVAARAEAIAGRAKPAETGILEPPDATPPAGEER